MLPWAPFTAAFLSWAFTKVTTQCRSSKHEVIDEEQGANELGDSQRSEWDSDLLPEGAEYQEAEAERLEAAEGFSIFYHVPFVQPIK